MCKVTTSVEQHKLFSENYRSLDIDGWNGQNPTWMLRTAADGERMPFEPCDVRNVDEDVVARVVHETRWMIQCQLSHLVKISRRLHYHFRISMDQLFRTQLFYQFLPMLSLIPIEQYSLSNDFRTSKKICHFSNSFLL